MVSAVKWDCTIVKKTRCFGFFIIAIPAFPGGERIHRRKQ